MKLSTRTDTKASIETAYAAFTDFERFEYRLQRRDIEITRDPDTDPVEVGCVWNSDFFWRNRAYKAKTELIALDPPRGLTLETRCRGVICLSSINLHAIPEGGTRIFASIELLPTTLSSRLLIQSLRLGKNRLQTKLHARIEEFALSIDAST